MTDINDVIANARPATKTVPLCLAGDLQAEWEDLDRQRRELLAKPREDSLASDGGELREVEELMDAIREQMAEKVVPFKIQGLPKRPWKALADQHPPREADRENGLDYHADTFPLAALVACCIDPKMTPEQAERLVDEALTQGQWDELWMAIISVNKLKVNVPKSVSGSA
ncbi:hypothetical protein [Sphaerimonospora thailandensis]|uniref:Tail assembly chaperone n=1 Tax=Sphaerimonospora thailandensis TaxID=795644 RepID=A0A8J3R6R6_9ACTN|nr:hypothetical protein [Sphaerimonospora thailandensis]GIH70346.1 hypothetical protein Mth01_25990 [Sphaerimonospora thailandensis]